MLTILLAMAIATDFRKKKKKYSFAGHYTQSFLRIGAVFCVYNLGPDRLEARKIIC